MVDVPYETELKLRVAPRVARKLPGHPAILDLKHGRVRTTRLRSVYFDTPDFRLARAGISVRLRHAGRDWLQTAKAAATTDTAGGLAQRIECEWRLGASRTRPPLDYEKLARTPFRHAIEKATRDTLLRPVFVTRFERTTVPVRFDDGTLATVCIDIGSIHAEDDETKAGKVPVAEVEIELASGNAARLFELALKLAEDVPMGVETRSKAARGYALLQKPERVATAQPLDYAADATAATAFAAILRNCLQHIEVNAEALSRGPDVEAVHQMRVGVRRMRAATALLRRAVDETTLQSLADDLRWLGDVLGEVRDLDVFGSQTLAALGAASQRLHDTDAGLAASIDELRGLAATQADVARSTARAAIASPRYVKLILRLGCLATTLAATAPLCVQPVDLSQPARAFASARLARRHRKLRRAAKELATSSSEQRHALRVQAKKMRYASEFFAPLFGTKRTRRYVAALVALQRELGAANDASVAARMAGRLAPGRSSAAVVAGWTSAHGSDPKRIERLWRDVARAKRFWDREARDRDATVL